MSHPESVGPSTGCPMGPAFLQPLPEPRGPSGPLELTGLSCWLDTALAPQVHFFLIKMWSCPGAAYFCVCMYACVFHHKNFEWLLLLNAKECEEEQKCPPVPPTIDNKVTALRVVQRFE